MMWTQNSILLREADAVYIRFRSDKINEDGWSHRVSASSRTVACLRECGSTIAPPFGQSGSRLAPIRASALGVLSA